MKPLRFIPGYYSLYHDNTILPVYVKLTANEAKMLFKLANELGFNNIVLERDTDGNHLIGDMTFIASSLAKTIA